jgi:hypothetical protein
MSKVRDLNDAFRLGVRPELGRIMITSGARDAVAAWPLGVMALHAKVRGFNTFTNDNDPHKEHDFGSVEHVGLQFFFKIDYYDKSMEAGSEDPADEKQTTRVLTIMLASEY